MSMALGVSPARSGCNERLAAPECSRYHAPMPAKPDGDRRPKGEGTIRWRADGRCEGREPPETVPPGEKPRSVYGRKGDSPAAQEREVKRKLREMRREPLAIHKW
jgi:hypothetical protein